MVVFSGCSQTKYNEDDFLGLTSKEIQERYGKFDNVRNNPDDDGLYKLCRCGYIVKPAQKGFWGKTEPELFMISFDANGIAYKCVYEIGIPGG